MPATTTSDPGTSVRTEPLRVRLLEPAEVQPAEDLLHKAFAPYVRRLGRVLRPQTFAHILDAVTERRVYGAFSEAELIGVAIIRELERGWYLDQIGVDPSLQGAGLGRAFLRALEAEAQSAGVETIALNTAEMMTHLLKFYHAEGFREVRRGPPDHDFDAHTRVYFEKKL
ncbi:GNAT family N-acetyltransferase [Algihabitans sp.]|uniref:GNAT family N-acetyltransferase n=1 Tax=Algihabitans sp. TaxID=2821514 RepID=UPI003BA85769